MKFTKVVLKMQDTKSKSKERIESYIGDGKLITRFTDYKQAYQTFLSLKEQKGDPNYQVDFTRGVIFETFNGKKRKEIEEYALKQEERVRAEIEKKNNNKIKFERSVEEVERHGN